MKKELLIKTPIYLLLILIMMCSCFLMIPLEIKANAMELNNDECDVVFLENIKELAKENYNGDITITASKEYVFDMDLNPMGFVYTFYVNNEEGYAIVINTSGTFELQELFFHSTNPYTELNNANRVYVKNMVYLWNSDGHFGVVGVDTFLTEAQLNSLRSIALYADGGTLTSSSETIYYTSKSENKFENAKRHPGITHISGYSNTCAPVAGANIVQFWDRYKTNLIANYTPGSSFGNFYFYKNPSSETSSVLIQLYSDMGTNSNGNGTTITQFKSGLVTYCARVNYSVTYTSLMSSNTFNYASAKQYLAAGIPVVIFLYGFNVVEIDSAENVDAIYYLLSDAAHVMSGFGYNEITYSFSDGTTRVDKYISVAAGLVAKQRGYLNVESNLQIDDAYAITVS